MHKEWVRCVLFFGGLLLTLAGVVFIVRFFSPGVPTFTPTVVLQLAWRSSFIVAGVSLFLWGMDLPSGKRGIE